MLRVLLITREPWRDDSNEGSVLSSWFENQPMEIAHIYCKPGLPANKCCQRYFQLTDQMAAKNLLKRESMGRAFELTQEQMAGEEPSKPASEQEMKSFYDFFRRHNWTIFFLMQEFLWRLANWKSKALEDFVDDFAPDVIVAPLCYSRFVMAIQRWVAKRLNKPMVGIVWDDLYSLKQWRFSPIFWLNRFLQRAAVKKTVDRCHQLYTLCPQQAEAFGELFGRSFGVFPKVGAAQNPAQNDAPTVRFIYAGGIYYGRMDTLAQVVEALEQLDQQGSPCRLDVYTNSADAHLLAKEGICTVHSAVSADELKQQYARSHVALHVEGFKPAELYQCRLSFSSKIVDCLASGCAVLAICPEENCGFRYLRDREAAVCVHQPEKLSESVEMLVCDAQQRSLWAERAKACIVQEHSSGQVQQLICQHLTQAAQASV